MHSPVNIVRPNLSERLEQFETALFEDREIAERVLAGQQFNAFVRAYRDEGEDELEEDGEDTEYAVCIGPVGSTLYLFDVTGRDRAMLVETALKVATEAFRERAAEKAEASQ